MSKKQNQSDLKPLVDAERELSLLLYARVLDSTQPGFYVVRNARDAIRETLASISKSFRITT